MFLKRLFVGLFLVSLAIGVVTAVAQQEISSDNSKSGWEAVEDALAKGLPKTAIEKLSPIIERSLAAKDYDAAIKAIAMRIVLEANIQGNKPEEKITRMKAEIAKAPDEMKPVMDAILANWYWHYFQQNRWRFMQRTQTDAAPSEDFTTWDLPSILAAIDVQFDSALASADVLKQTPVDDFDLLLEKGNAPQSYRPTMFDVLAHNALEFYSSGEQAGNQRQDAFVLNASSPIFSDRQEFIDWNPTTPDQDSLLLRAIKLYQELLRFHASDDERSALLDADLYRLQFGNDHAVGDDKRQRFKAALRRFDQANVQSPISTRALYLLAQETYHEGDLVEAHQIAESAITRFPDSNGANRARNLIGRIEAPSVSATAERVWNQPLPTIDITYRNVDKIYFRLVRFDFDEFVASERYNPGYIEDQPLRRLLAQNPAKAWSAELPETADYKNRTEHLPVPTDLEAGSYYLFSSTNESFSDVDQHRQLTEVWVSDLAFVMRNDYQSGVVEGMVTDAKTGRPIQGATVRGWNLVNQRRLTRKPLPSVTTDASGIFRFAPLNAGNVLVHVQHNGQAISSTDPVHTQIGFNDESVSQRTQFFTDRAIYRPGQTIRFKGICFSAQQSSDDYKTLDRQRVSVVFADPNGKEIERAAFETNRYGSFAGSFTAPRDRITGQMSIRVDDGPGGYAAIRVEEYKRPKFEVTIDLPKDAAKLNGEVKLTGTATAYTGVSISDASVTWRVVREVDYPMWWYWSRWSFPQRGESQEIANGTTTTSGNGTFDLSFVATPDASVSEETEPTFRFTVYADVTDTTGETRSDQFTINLGYAALKASMSADDWLTTDQPFTLKVSTTSLDGEGRSAKGTVKIHSLKAPESVVRSPLTGRYSQPDIPFDGLAEEKPAEQSSNPNDWPLGDVVFESEFQTDGAGQTNLEVNLEVGVYRAVLATRDAFGNEVSAILPLHILDLKSTTFNPKIPNVVAVKQSSLEPGDTFEMVWGSGYESAQAYIEIEHRGELLQSFWTPANQTQVVIRQEVTEAMRGGFHVRVTMVRENRAYLTSRTVDVPWSNKQLEIAWEHFTSKLGPSQKETWSAIIAGKDAERVAAEMVATLYDASLDAFSPHQWMSGFGVFRQDHNAMQLQFQNRDQQLIVPTKNNFQHINEDLTYPRLSTEIVRNLWGYGFWDQELRMMRKGGAVTSAAPSAMAMEADSSSFGFAMASEEGATLSLASQAPAGGEGVSSQPTPSVDLDNVSVRTNLSETAFFFPHLIAGDDGTVKMEFTMPEALTKWNFLGFAHDTELRAGLLTDSVVTSKDLMVVPNPPRFLREGDQIEFTVKVSNQSATSQSGSVRLSFADATTSKPVNDKLGNTDTDQMFSLGAGESKTFAWRLSVPEAIGFLTYKAVASSGRLSDGEEGYLPVLSKRILVTESIALPIRGKQSKQFEFTKLLDSANSKTLKHESLTVQMVSNPSWYAVLALPYLMEYPYECNEQTFSRLYANALARHIVTSDPKIERVFAQWRATPALDSPLEKNQDLKSVMLEETPWYAQAQSESQSRRDVGVLFDQNRLESEIKRSLAKLAESQLDDGTWSWFPGGRRDEYITLYITTGFGRLRHLGVNVDADPAIKAMNSLDAWATKVYRDIRDKDLDESHVSSTMAMYLYGRSFFLQDQPIAAEHREAVDYWLAQAKRHWLKLGIRQCQAQIALALKRFGDASTPQDIVASIRERSVTDEEMGMFWRENEISWWWYRAPIETQAMMIEMFDEVAADKEAVEACKVWLLKQKQTQDWKTTKATADAVYALLLRGSDLLASSELVSVSLGGQTVNPEAVEAGTGFYTEKFSGGEVSPAQGEIVVTRLDEGVAWGSVHWQYLEDIGEVTPHQGTPLTLSKQLFVKKNTTEGPTLNRVDGPVAVGDELVVRIVLKTDRDMEYVHMKDHRGSGTEPVNVLSRYKFQDGLAYYESTKDTASHFFIDYLPKGTYVFEYSTRVQLRGEYETGVASVQCMYAPEFNSHSESLPLEVK